MADPFHIASRFVLAAILEAIVKNLCAFCTLHPCISSNMRESFVVPGSCYGSPWLYTDHAVTSLLTSTDWLLCVRLYFYASLIPSTWRLFALPLEMRRSGDGVILTILTISLSPLRPSPPPPVQNVLFRK